MPQKFTTEEFIRRARMVHGDKYDYSKTDYKSIRVPVTITCPVHGDFVQDPNGHINGNGCTKCGIASRAAKATKTKETFINEANDVHKGKYDYSLVKYENTHKNVTIVCPEHGPFNQTPNSHLRGQGCPVCGNKTKAEKNRMAREEFILKAREVHGWKYDYSKVNMNDPSGKVTIICPKHGEFVQNKTNHLQGQGCPVCADKEKTTSQEDIVDRCKKRWGDRFDYSKTIYQETRRKITVTCPKHGDFQVLLKTHLTREAGGCPDCKKYNKGSSAEGFIAKAKAIHGDKYDYSKVNYIDSDSRVEIICPEHGVFWQTPYYHLHGNFCPKCMKEANRQGRAEEFYSIAAKACEGQQLDFSESIYTDINSNVTVRCRKHGYFTKKAILLKLGHGCPMCSRESRSLLGFIEENHDFLLSMPSNSLLEFLRENRMPKAFYELIYSQNGSVARENAIQRLRKSVEISPDIEAQENVVSQENDIAIDIETSGFTEKENESAHSNLGLADDSSSLDELRYLSHLPDRSGHITAFMQTEFNQWLWNDIISGRITEEEIRQKADSPAAEQLLEEFRQEYSQVKQTVPDPDCRFPYPLTLMQRLVIHRMLGRSGYANWSGMGTGKTIAALVAARKTESRMTVVIAPKDVIAHSWLPQIREAYPATEIWTNAGIAGNDIHHFTTSLDLNPSGQRYACILVNYDKFSSEDYYPELRDAISKVRPDFFCLDEVQYIKVRYTSYASRRHLFVADLVRTLRKHNPQMKIHLMSGTPVINNLREPKSLVNLLDDKQPDDNKGILVTVNNVHKAYRDILMNGFRYKPSSLHGVKITRPSVDGTQLAGRVASLDPQKGILPIERILCKAKLNDPSFKESVRPGTIIYTTYVDGIISPVLKAVNALGYSGEAYTGNNDDRDGAFVRFVEGKTDILVSSKPVILGVDGLQNRCNRIVILSLPWTWADYEQLIGRINRPRGAGNALNGSSIEVIIPQVNINTETGASWSWDRRRLALITNKRTLGEAVVDGTIDKIYTIDKKALLSQAIENLTSITNAEK